jgi:glycosyltransferase involved in cell wall biosynthesis
MAKLIAGIIAYNEELLLSQCLESIKDKVDKIVLVEGRIKTFPGDSVRSTDRTIEIAQDYGCEIITQDKPWKNEAEMRNQYLVGDNGDWYVLLDCDEKCMTPLPKPNAYPADATAYAIKSWMISVNSFIWRPRIFKHVGKMEYRDIHDALFSNGRLISRPDDVPKLHSVWFAHYQPQRDEIRRRQKIQYFQDGYSHEPEFRAKWGMFNRAEDVR